MMADEGDERIQATYGPQLRAPGGGEGHIRSAQPVPRESEHQAGGMRVADAKKFDVER